MTDRHSQEHLELSTLKDISPQGPKNAFQYAGEDTKGHLVLGSLTDTTKHIENEFEFAGEDTKGHLALGSLQNTSPDGPKNEFKFAGADTADHFAGLIPTEQAPMFGTGSFGDRYAGKDTQSHLSAGMVPAAGTSDATPFDSVYGTKYEGKDTKSSLAVGSLVPDQSDDTPYDNIYDSRFDGKDTEGHMNLSTLNPESKTDEPFSPAYGAAHEGWDTRDHFGSGMIANDNPEAKLMYGGVDEEEWKKAKQLMARQQDTSSSYTQRAYQHEMKQRQAARHKHYHHSRRQSRDNNSNRNANKNNNNNNNNNLTEINKANDEYHRPISGHKLHGPYAAVHMKRAGISNNKDQNGNRLPSPAYAGWSFRPKKYKYQTSMGACMTDSVGDMDVYQSDPAHADLSHYHRAARRDIERMRLNVAYQAQRKERMSHKDQLLNLLQHPKSKSKSKSKPKPKSTSSRRSSSSCRQNLRTPFQRQPLRTLTPNHHSSNYNNSSNRNRRFSKLPSVQSSSSSGKIESNNNNNNNNTNHNQSSDSRPSSRASLSSSSSSISRSSKRSSLRSMPAWQHPESNHNDSRNSTPCCHFYSSNQARRAAIRNPFASYTARGIGHFSNRNNNNNNNNKQVYNKKILPGYSGHVPQRLIR